MNFRKATLKDTHAIHSLIMDFAKQRRMLPRSKSSIEHELDSFLVAVDEDGSVVACGALYLWNKYRGEIRSLAVNPQKHRNGLGKKIIAALEEEARQKKLNELFALTLEPLFFKRCGYEESVIHHFAEKLANVCSQCPYKSNCEEIPVRKYI